MRTLSNIFWLGTKELRSLLSDWVLLGLVIYSFSLAVVSQAQSNSQELHHASIGIVDEDHSELSRRIGHAFLMPYFKPPVALDQADIEHLMNMGNYTFVVDIPPNFQRDVLAGHRPEIQVNVDATAMVQAGLGSGYPDCVQSKCCNCLVHQRDGHHLQHHASCDYPGRCRSRSRTRTWNDGSPDGNALKSVRDRDVENLGQWLCHRACNWSLALFCCASPSGCS